MRNRTLAAGGVLSALALLFLLAASMLPAGRLGCAALAGVVGAVVLIRCGWRTGMMSWIAVSVLALLLSPNKGSAVLYTIFFGPYTLIKNRIERLNCAPAEWLLKLLFCLAVSVLVFFFSADVLGLFPPVIAGKLWLFLPAVTAAFAAYDIVFSKMIAMLLARLPK